MCSGLVLLDVIPLHDSSLLVQPKVPGPSGGLLPVHHGGVGDVVILKDRLLELTLWGKMLLLDKCNNTKDGLTKGAASQTV